MSDLLIETWPAIARFLNIPLRRAYRRRKQMLECGVIFLRKRKYGEKPVMCAWSSNLRKWVEIRANTLDARGKMAAL